MSQKAYILKSNPNVKRWVHGESGSTGYQGIVPAGTVEEDWEEVPFVSDIDRQAKDDKDKHKTTPGSKKRYDAYIQAGYSEEYARERSNYTGE